MVLGFVLAVCVLEQIRPAQRRPSSGLAYTVLVVEAAAFVLLALTAWLQLAQRGRR